MNTGTRVGNRLSASDASEGQKESKQASFCHDLHQDGRRGPWGSRVTVTRVPTVVHDTLAT